MYTENQELLRNSLWNFFGSILTSSIHQDKKAKENVTALVSEELCKFCKTEDGKTIDMEAAAPILKACIWLLTARKQEYIDYQKNSPNESIALQVGIDNLDNLINSLQVYVDKLK